MTHDDSLPLDAQRPCSWRTNTAQHATLPGRWKKQAWTNLLKAQKNKVTRRKGGGQGLGYDH